MCAVVRFPRLPTLLLVIFVVAVSACARRPSPGRANPGPAPDAIRASRKRRRPVVLGLPGMRNPVLAAGAIWGDYRIQWSRLKDAPPPPPTEHTVGNFVLTSASAAELGKRYLEGISRTAWEFLPLILDHLVARPDVDPKRIALGGASTNGFAALQAASREKRFAAVGAFLACGDYFRFLQDSSMGMAGKPLALDPAYADWIRTQEVIRFPDTLPPTPILLTGRVGDPLIPIACVDTTAEVLTDAYLRAGVPGNFRFERFALEGHGYAANEQAAWEAFLRGRVLP
jgi:dienelactone hydrolase